MPDKKLTDAEIIKALECCCEAELKEDCKKLKCPFFDNENYNCMNVDDEVAMYRHALDLINRLQAENERLKPFEDKIAEYNSHIRVEDMLVFASSLGEWLEFCENLKAEAYKECIALIKQKAFAKHKTIDNEYLFEFDGVFLDNLLKELVGETK